MKENRTLILSSHSLIYCTFAYSTTCNKLSFTTLTVHYKKFRRPKRIRNPTSLRKPSYFDSINLRLVLAASPYSLAILPKWSRLQDVIVLQMVYYSCLISDTKPLARDVRQGVFSRKESGDGEDGAVEQHLSQFEVNPVP
jgi:hypothetical protein